nr:WecB/TagA/CpsF family glycosyltransferase [Pseudomaricurvus sp. HS19]
MALDSSDYLLRDGAGVEIALRMCGKIVGDNNNGTDLIPELLSALGCRTVSVLGSTDQVIDDFSHWVFANTDLRWAGGLNGFDYVTSDYLSAVKLWHPEVILLAMGMPKQELLAREIKEAFPNLTVVIISGGAILNFLTGRELRSPKIFRNLRLEWLWRLANDPVRLSRRYIIGNVVFLLGVLRLKIKFWALKV